MGYGPSETTHYQLPSNAMSSTRGFGEVTEIKLGVFPHFYVHNINISGGAYAYPFGAGRSSDIVSGESRPCGGK
jgi:hypothetical protein